MRTWKLESNTRQKTLQTLQHHDESSTIFSFRATFKKLRSRMGVQHAGFQIARFQNNWFREGRIPQHCIAAGPDSREPDSQRQESQMAQASQAYLHASLRHLQHGQNHKPHKNKGTYQADLLGPRRNVMFAPNVDSQSNSVLFGLYLYFW